MTKPGTLSSPHEHDNSSVISVMARVYLALVPGVAAYVWYFGAGVLVQCLLAVWFALALLWQKLSGRRAPVRTETPEGEPADLGFGVHVPFGPMLAIAGAGLFFAGRTTAVAPAVTGRRRDKTGGDQAARFETPKRDVDLGG